jgi:hypothetical protein
VVFDVGNVLGDCITSPSSVLGRVDMSDLPNWSSRRPRPAEPRRSPARSHRERPRPWIGPNCAIGSMFDPDEMFTLASGLKVITASICSQHQ